MHLYGGAAAMLDDVMRVQWEVEVYWARVPWPLPGFGPAVEERPEDDQEDVGQEGGQKKRGGVGEFFFCKEILQSNLDRCSSTCYSEEVATEQRLAWIIPSGVHW